MTSCFLSLPFFIDFLYSLGNSKFGAFLFRKEFGLERISLAVQNPLNKTQPLKPLLSPLVAFATMFRLTEVQIVDCPWRNVKLFGISMSRYGNPILTLIDHSQAIGCDIMSEEASSSKLLDSEGDLTYEVE